MNVHHHKMNSQRPQNIVNAANYAKQADKTQMINQQQTLGVTQRVNNMLAGSTIDSMQARIMMTQQSEDAQQ